MTDIIFHGTFLSYASLIKINLPGARLRMEKEMSIFVECLFILGKGVQNAFY